MSMELQRLLSLTRKAVDEYDQIQEGDRIAVGISGGKDSLTLLYALANLRRFYPNRYDLCAVTVDLGFEGFDTSKVRKLCEDLDVPYTVIRTDIYDIVFNTRKETNPCSLCAKMRKGSLNETISQMGYNKVAYAHHKDDVVETLMLSLIFEGRFNTFSPVTYLDRKKITVIRPLLYVEESDIIGFMNRMDLPVIRSLCPVDGNTKREYVKNVLNDLNRDNPGVKDRMFTAIEGSFIKGWNNNGKHELS